MADLDRLLRPDIAHAAADSVQPPDFTQIEHRGAQRRRTQTMLVAAASIVVVALVAAGTSIVIDSESTAPPPASPGRPTPTFGSMPSGDGARNQAIEPGHYRIPASEWSAVDFTITFPEGWTVQYGHIYHHGNDDVVNLEAAVVDEIYTDACHLEGVPMEVGPRVQDLVTALRKQRGPVASRPMQTTLGGYPATRINLRVPKRLELKDCRLWNDGGLALQIWYSQPADNYFVLFPDAVASVYILDVDGQRQVFVAQNRSPGPADARAELEQVLDSIRIGR